MDRRGFLKGLLAAPLAPLIPALPALPAVSGPSTTLDWSMYDYYRVVMETHVPVANSVILSWSFDGSNWISSATASNSAKA